MLLASVVDVFEVGPRYQIEKGIKHIVAFQYVYARGSLIVITSEHTGDTGSTHLWRVLNHRYGCRYYQRHEEKAL